MTVGFVVGCAWSAVVGSHFPSIASPPTAAVIATNAALAVVLTSFAVLWLVLSGARSNAILDHCDSLGTHV